MKVEGIKKKKKKRFFLGEGVGVGFCLGFFLVVLCGFFFLYPHILKHKHISQ